MDIIIPVYNTPRPDLDRCMNSIRNQTYSEWKAVLIDDGSSSETADYLDELAGKDDRIRVFHIRNGGVSNARNFGLENSSSPFFCFCDSDDEFTSEFLEDAAALIEQQHSDLVIGGVEVVENDKVVEACASENGVRKYAGEQVRLLSDYLLATQSYQKNSFLHHAYLGRPYPKLYRRSSLGEVRFEKSMMIHEDNVYSMDIFSKAESVCVTSKMYYRYWQNPYSLTHHKTSKRDFDNEILFMKNLLRRVRKAEDPEDIYDAAFVRSGIIIRSILLNAAELGFSGAVIRKMIRKLLENPVMQDLIRHGDIQKYPGLKNKIGTLSYAILKILHLNSKTCVTELLMLVSRIMKLKNR